MELEHAVSANKQIACGESGEHRHLNTGELPHRHSPSSGGAHCSAGRADVHAQKGERVAESAQRCGVCGELPQNCSCNRADGPGEKRVYRLENLGCANCAAKMESRIQALPGVGYAAISFATKQLRITADDPNTLLPEIRAICRAIEPEVEVIAGTDAPDTPQKPEKQDKALWVILVGAGLLGLGGLAERLLLQPQLAAALFVCAYLLLGWDVLRAAGRNLVKGQVFDENFLMSIATIGALILREYPEAVGVMLFFCIGEYFEHRAVEKSRGEIMKAVDMRPETVTLLLGDTLKRIPAADAQVGDILLVRAGDRIPLDGVVVDGESRLDTSPVTGESLPVAVGVGSEVLSGTLNQSGLLKIRVEKVLEESMVSRILNSVESAAASKPRIDRFITRFARVYTPIVLLLALGVAVIPSLLTGEWRQWVYTALTFLVISCPCALVLSVPLAFFSGIGAASRQGILLKGGAAMEALSAVKAVVMDKTGTITKGDFSVQQVLPEAGVDAGSLLAVAAACETGSSHPIAASLVAAAREQELNVPRAENLREIAGQGLEATIAGRQVLCGNDKLLRQNGIAVPDFFANGTQVLVALDQQYAGRLVIADTIKPDAAGAVAAMQGLGLHTVMLTGDTEEHAQKVAQEVGVAQVRARLLPEDKVQELRQVREKKGAVLFVGDGINDAPVLAAADVGAAMGSGADAAIEVADIVFMTSSLSAVPESLRIANATTRIAMQNVLFALGVKMAVMALGLMGHASMWMAVFADSGVSMLCVLNSIRILKRDSNLH